MKKSSSAATPATSASFPPPAGGPGRGSADRTGRRPVALLGLVCPILVLAGCATDNDLPAEQLYQAPALGAAAAARLTGTKVVESGIFADDHIGYALMVDNKFVQDALQEWNRPIALAPGWHEIAASYQSGGFSSRTTIRFQARAGFSYLLKIAAGTESDGDHRYCDFSIVDAATGAAVTAVKHCNVSGDDKTTHSMFHAVD